MRRTILGVTLTLMLAPGTVMAQPGQQSAPAKRPQFNTPGNSQSDTKGQMSEQRKQMQKRIEQMRKGQQKPRNMRRQNKPGKPGAASAEGAASYTAPEKQRQMGNDASPQRQGNNQQRTKRFSKIDSNNDNTITFQEFRAETSGQNVKRVFNRIDLNGDGKVTREEARQYANTAQQKRGGR